MSSRSKTQLKKLIKECTFLTSKGIMCRFNNEKINDNEFEYIMKKVKKIDNVTSIHANNNNITILKNEYFIGMNTLRYLLLSCNPITILEDKCFDDLSLNSLTLHRADLYLGYMMNFLYFYQLTHLIF